MACLQVCPHFSASHPLRRHACAPPVPRILCPARSSPFARCSANLPTTHPLWQAKEQEKETLVGMCNELVNRLEREGLSLA